MSVADKLAALASDIGDCYDEVQSKGGTIPQNKNTNNLATAIATIPTGITPTGQIAITQNGTYDVTAFSSASVAVAGGLRYATGTFTLTSSQFAPVINWNLDFLPSLVFVRPANATTETTTGIWGSYFILKKDYYTGEEISPYWVNTIRVVYYYFNGNFRSQTPTNGGIVEQSKLTLGYYTADAVWKPNVEYRWYAIGGAQET